MHYLVYFLQRLSVISSSLVLHKPPRSRMARSTHRTCIRSILHAHSHQSGRSPFQMIQAKLRSTSRSGIWTLTRKSYDGRAMSRLDIMFVSRSTKHLKSTDYSILIQGVLNHFFPPSATEDNGHPVPIDLLITGTVPAGSGLSSSAAMVVASTLAFLAANDKLAGITKGALVEMAIENEQRVGVNSGG